MNMNVRKGDNVLVLTGKDKGKTGKVLSANPDKEFVTVEGVNMVVCHVKARSMQEKSGKQQKEGNIHVSNVQIVCPACSKNTRVRHAEVDGKKARVCAHCGASLDAAIKVEKTKKKAAPKTVKKEKKAKETKVEATAVNSKADSMKRSMNKESGDGR